MPWRVAVLRPMMQALGSLIDDSELFRFDAKPCKKICGIARIFISPTKPLADVDFLDSGDLLDLGAIRQGQGIGE